MACTVLEQHMGDLEVADGDCSEQGRVLGPTNLQIDKPPLVKPAADYQGAGLMTIVTISPCRPKPCQSTEKVDLGGSWHLDGDSQEEVRLIFVRDEPLQKDAPFFILDESVCWLGHGTSAEAGHYCDFRLLDEL